MKRYRFRFSIWGLILFAAILLPNLYWFAVPAPNDILRGAPAVPAVDAAQSAAQVLMIACLCLIRNRDEKPFGRGPLLLASAACGLLYFAAWAAYYRGIAGTAVLLALCLLPSLAFLLFAADRGNWPAFFSALAFTALHLVHTVTSFLLL